MKLKPTMKKPMIAGAVCFLVIAAIAAILILPAGNNGQDTVVETGTGQDPSDVSSGGEQDSASATDAGQNTAGQDDEDSSDGVTIRIYTTDRDIWKVIDDYAKKHWDFAYDLDVYNDEWRYGPTDIVRMVREDFDKNGGENVDIYVFPAWYAQEFVKGEYSKYAFSYKELGIDVDEALRKADIPECIVEDGLNPDGELVALPYQADTALFFYRRSVAKEVWGTDDPDVISDIIGSGTQRWDQFIEAAKTLGEHGYHIVPGFQDLEFMIDTTSSYLSISDEDFEIDPLWQEYMDVSLYLLENGYMKHTLRLYNEWYKDPTGQNDKVFGVVMPTDWFPFLGFNEAAGDWAACIPPFNTRVPSSTGIMVSKNSPHKELLGPLVEWITLDSSEDGFQYSLITGTCAIPNSKYENQKFPVISGTVMKSVDGSHDVLSGQNINQLVQDALRNSKGLYQAFLYEYDLFQGWMDAIRACIEEGKNMDAVVADYLREVRETGEVKPKPWDSSLDEKIAWKDENFKEAVREQLRMSKYAEIKKRQLIYVTELNLAGRDIKSLEDIVHFDNLAKLDISNNQISDISSLKELRKLRKIDLSGNLISDISPLSDMKYLKELYLNDNTISDISGLKGLAMLETLHLSGNEISDIKGLAGLQKLKDLNLAFNKISDISAIKNLPKLQSLNLAGNNITNGSPADQVVKVQWD